MTFESKFGHSKIEVQYLMGKDIVAKAREEDINLGKYKEILAEESFIKFFCSNVIVGWSGVMASDGWELEFSLDNLYTVFKSRPDVYYDVVMDSARLSNFKL